LAKKANIDSKTAQKVMIANRMEDGPKIIYQQHNQFNTLTSLMGWFSSSEWNEFINSSINQTILI